MSHCLGASCIGGEELTEDVEQTDQDGSQGSHAETHNLLLAQCAAKVTPEAVGTETVEALAMGAVHASAPVQAGLAQALVGISAVLAVLGYGKARGAPATHAATTGRKRWGGERGRGTRGQEGKGKQREETESKDRTTSRRENSEGENDREE